MLFLYTTAVKLKKCDWIYTETQRKGTRDLRLEGSGNRMFGTFCNWRNNGECDRRNRQQTVCHWLKESTERPAPRFVNHSSNKTPRTLRGTHLHQHIEYVCMQRQHAHTFTIHMRDQWMMGFLVSILSFLSLKWLIYPQGAEKTHIHTHMPEGSVFFCGWEEAAL